MFRAMLRWSFRALAAVVTLLVIAALAAHLGPVRERVRTFAEARLSAAVDGHVSIGRLRYNLFRLSATAHDVTIASGDGEAFFSAGRAAVSLAVPGRGSAPRHSRL